MDFQHAYSEGFRGSDLECKDPSLAQQHFKDDVDINVLLERFKVTGVMPSSLRLPTFGDFSGVSDFRSAADALRRAREGFLDLPAKLRARFDNDPQKLMEFLSDSKNRAEAEALGLVKAAPSAPPVSGSGEASAGSGAAGSGGNGPA